MSEKKFVNVFPDGFRQRRGLNWVSIGLMYATFYMCRYNFKMATPGLRRDLGFDLGEIAGLWIWWSLAYGTGQLINGLVSDRFGGKKCLLTGAIGTITISLLIGFTPLVEKLGSFIMLMMINAFFQSFGAPGFVKINAAWFRRNERGTFAGIFGVMIQLGQFTILRVLGPWILAGFVFMGHKVDPGSWRYLFIIPPVFTTCAALFLFFAVKETPDDAGYPGVIKDEIDDSAGVKMPISIVLKTIFTNPYIWFYAVAYMSTGAVRHSSDLLSNLFFADMMKFDMVNIIPPIAKNTLGLVVIMAVVGSIISGFISDKFFGGRRGGVSMFLYFMQFVILIFSALAINLNWISDKQSGIFMGCSILILISMAVNATHSLVGAAAPMDIGGKKMAGFASGVIDSFQYYGSALALLITGPVLDKYSTKVLDEKTGKMISKVTSTGWLWWFAIMGIFAFIGGVSMWLLIRKHKRLDKIENNAA